MSPKRRVEVRGWVLFLVAVAVGLSWVFTIAARQHAVNETTSKICAKIHVLDLALQQSVIASVNPKALLKFDYYKQHPLEIKVARQAALGKNGPLAKFRSADCSTKPARH